MPDLGLNLLRSAVLGVVAGMRSMMPLAVLATHFEHERSELAESSPLVKLLGSRWAARGLQLAAAGELVGDKLPFTPSRLLPMPLAFRVFVGGLAGATQNLVEDQASADEVQIGVLNAMVGALGAVVGSLAGFWLRTSLSRVLPLPSLVFALGEDALALALGRWAVRLRTGR